MKIDFITLFKPMFAEVLASSIMGRAREKGLVSFGFSNPRDFSRDKHKRVDDRPYGGGPGMLLKAGPVAAAIKSVAKHSSWVVYLSPHGAPFSARAAQRLSKERHLILVCGHYEGVDARLSSLFDEEISIGDYVLTGGELPAMVVADAAVRLIPGVLKSEETVRCESFSLPGLEHPQYTRPRSWRGRKVPGVLLSGDHGKISAWKERASRRLTLKKRPDLLPGNRISTIKQ
ncbi:MAG: tRNA (guanosine(37)-N1)-methyltransferase TrmD [Elusimicrobia bacterium]|nr:tRNA (guanosine(37)-N1)-methyltransferase TrmD [Elusimicrobiota bacterium]